MPEFERKLVDDCGAAASGARHRVHHGTGERLSHLGKGTDFRVAKGSADPRGWKVFGGDGVKLGKVTALIVDQEHMGVRFLGRGR